MEKKSIKTRHGDIKLPAFMPDATFGSIRNLSFNDVKNTGTKEIVTTTLHLEQKVGSSFIKKMGGVHKFFGWDRPILSDSGGWQVFSLINSHKGNKQNKITELGCSFIDPDTGKYSLLTPESSQMIQLNLGSDIVTALDNPIINNASLALRKESVRVNTNWAKRSRKIFDKIHTYDKDDKTHIGAVIQGGDDFKLRKQSADELLDIGFDIYNFGGVPLYSEISWKSEYPTGFYREMLHYVRDLLPKDVITYAMGVGQPDDIAFCHEIGWDLFDTVLPTRNARHGYLYVSEGQGDTTKNYKSQISKKEMNYDVMHLKSKRYEFDQNPIDEHCDCECCTTVTRSYLRYLIRLREPAGMRLATIHNLRFYAKWMESLKLQKPKIQKTKKEFTS